MDKSSLKVLYFSRGYTTHDRRYLQSLVDVGYQISYLRLLNEQLDSRPLPERVHPIPWVGETRSFDTPFGYLSRYISLQRILSDIRPQIVIAGPVQSSAFLVALTGYKPLVTMSWGSDVLIEANRSVWMRKITHYTLKRSAAVISDCRAVREKICGFIPFKEDRIVTFPWGIDLDSFVPRVSRLSLRQELGWTHNPILISTRTWEPLYAIDVLVSAYAIVHQRQPKARLILLGDGSQGPVIRALISQLNLNDYIYAPGRVSYELLPDYFCLADVYVSSALSDGTSISLLEAMACGLPVVVTNSDGNREWVKPGQNGWLVKPGDYAELANALDEALADPFRRAEMKAANTSLAQNKADWKKNFPQLLQLLQRATGSSFVVGCQNAGTW